MEITSLIFAFSLDTYVKYYTFLPKCYKNEKGFLNQKIHILFLLETTGVNIVILKTEISILIGSLLMVLLLLHYKVG